MPGTIITIMSLLLNILAVGVSFSVGVLLSVPMHAGARGNRAQNEALLNKTNILSDKRSASTFCP